MHTNALVCFTAMVRETNTIQRSCIEHLLDSNILVYSLFRLLTRVFLVELIFALVTDIISITIAAI